MNETLDNVTNKTAYLSSILEKEIRSGIFRPGSRIYSMRDICRKFDVSITVANGAYSRLEELGLVERRFGSGTFVRSFRDRDKKTFILLTSIRSETMEHYYSAIFDAARQSGNTIIPQCIHLDDRCYREIDHVLSYQPNALLVDFGEQDCSLDILQERIGATPVCFVNRWEWDRPLPEHAVLVDHQFIVSSGLHYFCSQGHRKILYLGHALEPQQFKRKYLEAAAAEHGLRFPSDEFNFASYRDFAENPERIKRIFADDPPTAIISRGDTILYNFMIQLQAMYPKRPKPELLGCYQTVWSRLPLNEFRSFKIDFKALWLSAMNRFDWRAQNSSPAPVEWYRPQWPQINTTEGE